MFEFIHYAQINGGRRAGAEEKGALEEWHIQNASFWLDIRIILRTMGRFVRRLEAGQSKLPDRDRRKARRQDPAKFTGLGRTGHETGSSTCRLLSTPSCGTDGKGVH